jgi:hypothetical protein
VGKKGRETSVIRIHAYDYERYWGRISRAEILPNDFGIWVRILEQEEEKLLPF